MSQFVTSVCDKNIAPFSGRDNLLTYALEYCYNNITSTCLPKEASQGKNKFSSGSELCFCGQYNIFSYLNVCMKTRSLKYHLCTILTSKNNPKTNHNYDWTLFLPSCWRRGGKTIRKLQNLCCPGTITTVRSYKIRLDFYQTRLVFVRSD